MDFSKELNKYMEILNCTGKELSIKSKIPAPIISGYKNGTKVPKYESDNLFNLINALYFISKEKKINIKKTQIKEDLEKYLVKDIIDFDTFRENFNIIIKELNINVSDLSKYIGFDSSFVSKIKSGVRKPLNLSDFAGGVSKYVTNYYYDTHQSIIKKIINDSFNNEEELNSKLLFWLTNNSNIDSDDYKIDSFFKKLDDFDLNNYIKAIKFDKLIVPTLPKALFKTKSYYGIEGYKDSQLEVLKQIAFSKTNGEVFWFSNLPMEEISKDLKFTKKYMMYLAFILKKGLTLNIIHDINRPFNELMLGLEGWIPLYMTGQINPYYYKKTSDSVYQHIECASDTAILHGESIKGHLKSSKFLVSNKKDDIIFYKTNADLLLKKALPLMSIYNDSNKNDFYKSKKESEKLKLPRRNILMTPPIYTISDELLERLFINNKTNSKDKTLIKNYLNEKRKTINNLLKDNSIQDEITILTKEEFNENTITLDLSEIMYNKKIIYTYEDYINHIKHLDEFKKENKNYKYKINDNNIFKNINIHIIKDKEVIISKTNNPITHFVIHHPTLINAIENFKVPIKEE